MTEFGISDLFRFDFVLIFDYDMSEESLGLEIIIISKISYKRRSIGRKVLLNTLGKMFPFFGFAIRFKTFTLNFWQVYPKVNKILFYSNVTTISNPS